MKKSSDNQNALLALNKLLSNDNAIQFLNLLFNYWMSPSYAIFDLDLFNQKPINIAKDLSTPNSPAMSYAIKCNMERLLLNYLDTHGIHNNDAYSNINPTNNIKDGTEMDTFIEE